MNEEPRSCPDCSASYFVTDNYCRQCGMYVAALREMPLVKTEAAVPARTERERAALPAPVRKAATALAIGTALQIGVGLAGRYVASQAARRRRGPRSTAQPHRAASQLETKRLPVP